MVTQSESVSTSAHQRSADGKYETLFENVQGAAFLTQYDGTILEANQRSCDLFGYPWKDLIQGKLQKLLPSSLEWDEIQDEIASHGGLNIETEGVRHDGSIFPVEVSSSLFQFKKQPVMFFLIRDITERKDAEKLLKEQEAKYHGLFEYASDGMFVLDVHGDILEVNNKLCSLVGYAKKDMIGKNLFNMNLLTAESLPIVLREFEQLLSEKTSQICSTEIRRKAGDILEVEISSFFLVRKNNEVDNFVVLVRDVTQRNELEKYQRHEHETLRTLMDNIPDSVYFKDEQNRFVMVNKAKAAHSNVTPEDMIGKTDFDFMDQQEATRSYNDDTMIMQTGTSVVNKVERRVLPDGSSRWTSVTKIPWFKMGGDIIGTMGISRDISELQTAKEELEKSEARYRAVFENQSVAIIMTDEQQRIITWNSFAEDLLLMHENELRFRSIHTLFTEESWVDISQSDIAVKAGTRISEGMMKRKDGEVCHVEVSWNLLHDATGQLLGATWLLNDISKQKDAELRMRHHHELLMSLMDTIPDSIYFKDHKHRFILVNKAKALHWDCTPREMIGKTDFDFLPEAQAQKSFEDDSKVFSQGKPIVNKIERITDAEGKQHYISVTKVPRFNREGKIIGTLGISRDVSEWVEVRQQIE